MINIAEEFNNVLEEPKYIYYENENNNKLVAVQIKSTTYKWNYSYMIMAQSLHSNGLHLFIIMIF